MYANEFAANRGFKPGSMTLALALTALPIVGLITSMGVDRLIRTDPPLTTYPVHDDPPPPPDVQPKKKVDTKAPINERIPVPPIDPPIHIDGPVTKLADPDPLPPIAEVGRGTIIKPIPAIPNPVIVGPTYDQRYVNALQPPYPASEIRSGNTGRVVIKVLIGTDGRVKKVERISAASDAFFTAAERQALTKWRFKPATSDGTPIEQWKTMSLRFELQDQ
jgi:protein TonB